MALKALVDSLDSIDAGARALYKPIGEGDNKGKFILDVEPVYGHSLENVDGLKSTYVAVKGDLEKANTALKGYQGLKLKPSELSDKLKRLGELEAFDPETEADKRAQAKLQGFQTQLSSEFESKLGVEKTRNDSLTKQVEKLLVTNVLTEAVAKQKGIPQLLLPVLSSRIRVKTDEAGELTAGVVDERGQADFSFRDGKVVPSTIDDLVLKFKTDPTYGRAFEASGNGGSGAPPKSGGGGQGSQTYSLKDWQDKTSRATPDERKALFASLSAGQINVIN